MTEYQLVIADRRKRPIPFLCVGNDSRGTPRVELRRGIHQHETGELVRVSPGVAHRNAPAERMAHQDEALDVQIRERALEIVTQRIEVVAAVRCTPGIAVAAHIERNHSVVGGHYRSDVVPDVRVVGEAVDEKHRHTVTAPLERVKFHAVGSSQADRGGLHGADISAGRIGGENCQSIPSGPPWQWITEDYPHV